MVQFANFYLQCVSIDLAKLSHGKTKRETSKNLQREERKIFENQSDAGGKKLNYSKVREGKGSHSNAREREDCERDHLEESP